MFNFRFFVSHVKEIKEAEYFREKSDQENVLTEEEVTTEWRKLHSEELHELPLR